MTEFVHQDLIAAPPATVFEVLTDHRGYAKILPFRSARLERAGTPDLNGVGAVRALHLLGPPVREQVTVYEPPRRFAYKMLSGLPMRDYRGAVLLADAVGDQTDVIYTVNAGLPWPVPDFLTIPVSQIIVLTLLRGIKRESERRAAAPS